MWLERRTKPSLECCHPAVTPDPPRAAAGLLGLASGQAAVFSGVRQQRPGPLVAVVAAAARTRRCPRSPQTKPAARPEGARDSAADS